MLKVMIFTTAFALGGLGAGLASATTSCEKRGNGYKCENGGTVYNVPTASSAAVAAAAVENHVAQKQAQNQAQVQGQAQGQQQGQTSINTNDNSNSSSISNVIEGNPAHTTSFNVGVGVSVRLGEGVRARAVQDAADWLAHNGQKCLAMEAMLDLHPDLRRMNKTVKCVKH
jgi:hypothetical protein